MDALLLGRLKMTPTEALSAYSKISDALPTRLAVSDEERHINDQNFTSVFTEVLESVGLSTKTPLRDDGSSCST
jgi:hypothetical protein